MNERDHSTSNAVLWIWNFLRPLRICETHIVRENIPRTHHGGFNICAERDQSVCGRERPDRFPDDLPGSMSQMTSLQIKNALGGRITRKIFIDVESYSEMNLFALTPTSSAVTVLEENR